MNHENQDIGDEQAPWWGIGILYLMLTPFALLTFLAFKLLTLVWNTFDGSVGAKYAVSVFAILGCLLFVYVIMIVRQIYVEFISPKLAARFNQGRTRHNRT